jgi:hypothetical protein
MAQVFISYSKRDYIGPDGKVIPGNAVDLLRKALEADGISYWIDQEGLSPGVTYADMISRNIRDCDTFLFLSSANANSSEWTLREISTAIDFGKTVLPVRLDRSDYAAPVALYLSSVQYVDWLELGEEESLRRIVSRIQSPLSPESFRQFEKERLPRVTAVCLYAGLVFLTAAYAYLTYKFLWAKTLRSSEIMGGLVGYVAEAGILASIYYILRILRLRKCHFVFPALLTGAYFLAGMLLKDASLMISAGWLLAGWLLLAGACALGGRRGKNFFHLMSREQKILSLSDPENLILLYLIFKAVIIVVAHYIY